MQTVFVANRAEIAHRVIRTARALGYRTAVAASEADRDLPYTRAADRVVCWEGPSDVGGTYLDTERVLAAAKAAGADAVHPGYGFLSENADFAEAVVAAGLTWIGPPPEAIRAMGDKASARQVAVANGVPVVPGHEVQGQGEDGEAELLAAAQRIGFPVLIKAVAGGGGRGMRRVDAAVDFGEALQSAQREAVAAFGNGAVLLERYIERPRHIEVQILADVHGTVVSLGERECSIQRRHQKIIEEAPSPVVDDAMREAMGAAAVAVARAVGYVGAGTVEFIVDPQGSFFFLEMNTRLQVEHPVTECVTGLDLVALQLRIAEGEPLPFSGAVAIAGWSIEARVYAEDPMRDYLPATGTLHRLHVEEGEGIRVDAGYASGDAVSPFYDAMIAKVIASGPDRATASRRLRRAIEGAWAPGVVTNLPLLRQILACPEWAQGDLDTGFLPRVGLPRSPPLNLDRGVLAASALGRAEREARGAVGPAGWRIGGRAEQRDTYEAGDQAIEVAVVPTRAGFVAEIDGSSRRVDILGRSGDVLDLVVDGVRQRWRVARVPADPTHDTLDDGDLVYAHLGDGEAFVRLQPRFPPPAPAAAEPGATIAPTPGKVSALHVAEGDEVEAGQRLATIEAMKMEHPITASQPGRVVAVPRRGRGSGRRGRAPHPHRAHRGGDRMMP